MNDDIALKLIINALTSIAASMKQIEKQNKKQIEIIADIRRYQKASAGPGG